jgi:hypothetical protein
VALLGVLATGVVVPGYLFYVKVRRASEDNSIRSFQIRSAVDQFFLENRMRVFATYDDIVGPTRYVKQADSNAGEDYHELFPVRADFEAMGVTMSDGRVNLVLRDGGTVQHWPDGELRGSPENVRVYRALLSSRKDREGVHVTLPFQGGRFETTWRGGVPDGPFRAYYADGKLWAEATYVRGAPSGRHVAYDRTGKIIYETVFVPWRRGS